MADRTAHQDTFVRDNLPPAVDWPAMLFRLPELRYPARLNCATELLDRMVGRGFGPRPCVRFEETVWTYADLLDRANRIARVLVEDLGLVPGNRVLLRSANNPMLFASWLGVFKAGGVVVGSMPLYRARELAYSLNKTEVQFVLCDARLRDELTLAAADAKSLKQVLYFNSDAADSLEALMRRKTPEFTNCDTAIDDAAFIAFTSGTTGQSKAAVHFHRDLIAASDCFPRSCVKPTADDVFCGSPPLAFTYAIGSLLAFPLRFGASVALAERANGETLPQIIRDHKATIVFSAPTAYRVMADQADTRDLGTLKKGISAGETLPLPVFEAWQRKTGIKLMDGIGSTELLNMFISAPEEQIRPGSTGRAIPGYEAKIVDDEGRDLKPGDTGRLAVRGPTGCKYLADVERQRAYVRDRWNITGDTYRMDEDGYFWYQARSDDMIVSSGYKIAGPEVETVLLDHPKVKECAVIGSPDGDRGMIVKAFVVTRDPRDATVDTVKALQDFVKTQIAPFKYPRSIEFIDALPRTETGKVQRFKLRTMSS